jgi:DNA-binding NtrC family response regulator
MNDEQLFGATRIIERPDRTRVLMVQRSQLEVLKGPDAGAKLELRAEPATVGTDASCDLRLSDAAVSGQHLSVQPEEKGFRLRDLGSTNGTFVAGMRVEGLYLPPSVTIDLGETQLAFSLCGDEVEVPLSRRTRFGELLGHSESMRAAFAVLERVAESDVTLLVEGESGTGKELAARAVHEHSPRHGELFIAVDCGAIPASLIESELFGHVKGSFTGATDTRIGPFEQAHGGTVFLDEIGELPLDLQPKLLRALESREIRRVGENRTRTFDARLVAATNRNLEREVEAGRFRQDLYFRLSVIKVRMPPLRQRLDEIPRLVAHFLARIGADPAKPLPAALLAALQTHQWPGNVRELRNVVERLALVPGMSAEFYLGGSASPSESAPPQPEESNAAVPLDLSFHEGKRQWIEVFEREYLSQMLNRCKGNISELARVTGLSRQSCHRLLDRYGIGNDRTAQS